MVAVAPMGLVFCLLFAISQVATANVTLNAVLKPLLERKPTDPEIHTFEEFMPKLPRELREQYVLMTDSKSRHKSSKRYPRVISYMEGTDGAPFVLSFSGYLGDPQNLKDAKDPLYNVIELFAYQKETREWEAHSIEFSDFKGPKLGTHVSPKNPSSCYGCHGEQSLHPLWEPYPFWKGAVGEKGDLTTTEVAYLKDFVNDAGNHPRYGQLERQKNLNLNLKEKLAGALSLIGLQKTLITADVFRVQKLISETPDYERFRFAFLGSVLACPDLPSFFPESVGLGGKSHWEELKSTTQKALGNLQEPHANLIRYTQVPVTIVTNLRYVTESRKMDYSDWSLSGQHPLFFDTTEVDHLALASAMRQNDKELAALTFSEPAFESLMTPSRSKNSTEKKLVTQATNYCKALAKKSTNAFSHP